MRTRIEYVMYSNFTKRVVSKPQTWKLSLIVPINIISVEFYASIESSSIKEFKKIDN